MYNNTKFKAYYAQQCKSWDFLSMRNNMKIANNLILCSSTFKASKFFLYPFFTDLKCTRVDTYTTKKKGYS